MFEGSLFAWLGQRFTFSCCGGQTKRSDGNWSLLNANVEKRRPVEQRKGHMMNASSAVGPCFGPSGSERKENPLVVQNQLFRM